MAFLAWNNLGQGLLVDWDMCASCYDSKTRKLQISEKFVLDRPDDYTILLRRQAITVDREEC